jgi:hypothetical protein
MLRQMSYEIRPQINESAHDSVRRYYACSFTLLSYTSQRELTHLESNLNSELRSVTLELEYRNGR